MKPSRLTTLASRFFPHRAKMFLFNIIKHRRMDCPHAFGLEISTACNRRCHYCPQSVRSIKQQVVSDEVWRTFIFRLAEFRWKGMVTLHLYNEPALVPRSVNMVKELASMGCLPYLFTNGDKPDMIQKWLDAGAWRVKITEHPPFKDSWFPPIAALLEKYPDRVFVQRLQPWQLTNQAGKVDVQMEPFKTCRAPWGVSVAIDGSIGLCCLDIDHVGQFGSIMTQSLDKIWKSKRFKEARRKTARGESAAPLCDACFGRKPEPDTKTEHNTIYEAASGVQQ
jgi:GTP 3',8-cyclase